MTKYQKIQKISSVIPFLSTFFVIIATMVELKRRKAPRKMWLYFILIFYLSGIVVYLLNTVIMTGKHIYLNVIASGLVFAVANLLFVDLQVISLQTQSQKTRTSHKTRNILCWVALGVAIVGAAVGVYWLIGPSIDIEDINGSDNTSLAVITTNEILSNADHYSAFSSNVLQKGNDTNVIGRLKDCDYDEVSFHCQKISGVKTLQATKTSCNQLVLEINSQLETGNMEIIILVDDEYYDNVAVNQASIITLNNIDDKVVTVKIAAESAKMNISIKRFPRTGDGTVS